MLFILTVEAKWRGGEGDLCWPIIAVYVVFTYFEKGSEEGKPSGKLVDMIKVNLSTDD